MLARPSATKTRFFQEFELSWKHMDILILFSAVWVVSIKMYISCEMQSSKCRTFIWYYNINFQFDTAFYSWENLGLKKYYQSEKILCMMPVSIIACRVTGIQCTWVIYCWNLGWFAITSEFKTELDWLAFLFLVGFFFFNSLNT